MINKQITIYSLALSFLLSIFSTEYANAQRTISTSIEEIVVTAQRLEQNLQDVPVLVTAFSGDQLKELRIVTTDDVVDFTPGLTMFNPLGEGNTPNFLLRSVSNSGIFSLSSGYVQELYQPPRWVSLNLGMNF